MTSYISKFNDILFSAVTVALGMLLAFPSQNFAQGSNSNWRYATEEEEEMIAKGYVFFPALRVRTPEEKQLLLDEVNRRDQVESVKRHAEENARKLVIEEERLRTQEADRKVAEERARQEADDLARKQAAERAKAEAEEASQKLAEQRAKQEAEDLARRQAAERAKAEADELKAATEEAANKLAEQLKNDDNKHKSRGANPPQRKKEKSLLLIINSIL